MISTQTPTRHEFRPHNDQFFSPLAQQSGFTWKWLYSLSDLHMKTIASSVKILTQCATNFSHKKNKNLLTYMHSNTRTRGHFPKNHFFINKKYFHQNHPNTYPRHCIQKKRMVVNHLMHTLGWTPKQTTII